MIILFVCLKISIFSIFNFIGYNRMNMIEQQQQQYLEINDDGDNHSVGR